MNKKILIAGIAAIFLLLLVPSVSATWCDNDYSKKAPILINNTGGSAQTYYQVDLNYTHDSDMNANFSDIRVYNESDCSLIPLWNESAVASIWNKIWFNATNIPASSWTNGTYFLYYNYSSGSSVSDIVTTFPFGDEFDTLDTGNDGNVWGDSAIYGFASSPPICYPEYKFADINEDGEDEIIVAFGESGKILAFNKTTGSRVLDIDCMDVGIGDVDYTSDGIAVADIDDDSHLDIVALQRVKADTGGSERHNGTIYCRYHNGTERWTKVSDHGVENFKTVIIGNFNTSVSGLEIAVLGEGTLLMLDKDGNELYYVTLDAGATYSETGGMVKGNFGDGGVTNLICRYHLKNVFHKVCSDNGTVLATYTSSGTGTEDMYVKDINDDGTDEIIFTNGATVGVLWANNMTAYWTKTPGAGTQVDECCVADLDNDGEYEILAGGKDKIVWCYNEAGTELWNYSVGGTDVIYSVEAGNVTGDSNLEILAGFSCSGYVGTGRVLILDKDGNFLKDLHPDNESRDVTVANNTIYVFNYGLIGGYDYDTITEAKWTEEGSPTVAGGYLELSATSGYEILRSTNLQTIVDSEIRLRQKNSAISGFDSRFGATDEPSGQDWYPGIGADPDSLIMQKYRGDGYLYTDTVNDGTKTENQRTSYDTDFHTYRFSLTSSKAVFYEDTTSWEHTTNLPNANMYVWLQYQYISTTGTSYTDWVFVRKYASPEPTAQLGTEESPSVTYTPPDPTNLQHTSGNFYVNYTWDAGSGNVTNGYNVTWNSSWYNTSNEYMNKSVGASNWANITVWAWNSSSTGTMSAGNVSDEVQVSGATDTSFTVTLPVGYTYAHFQPPNSTAKNYSCNGQNSTTPFYNVTNTGNVYLHVRMKLNATITNVILRADTDNNPSGSSIIQTTLVTIGNSLSIGNSMDIWIWSDFNHTIQQTVNRTLYINVTENLNIPPDPVNLQHTTGNYWVNYTWDAGTGNITDSYNINWNETDYNNIVDNFMNKSVGAGNWANITVYAWNSTDSGAQSIGNVTDKVQVSGGSGGTETLYAEDLTSESGNTINSESNAYDAANSDVATVLDLDDEQYVDAVIDNHLASGTITSVKFKVKLKKGTGWDNDYLTISYYETTWHESATLYTPADTLTWTSNYTATNVNTWDEVDAMQVRLTGDQNAGPDNGAIEIDAYHIYVDYTS